MKTFRVPRALHELFGETQTVPELALVFVGATVATAVVVASDLASTTSLLRAVAPWRAVVALGLLFDIAAGAVANFSHGTNDFYAARPRLRLGFLAVHVHVPVFFLVLGAALAPGVVAWVYTIAGAFLVNALGPRVQRPAAGAVVIVGLALGASLAPTAPLLQATSALFLIKLVPSFAVNHAAWEDSPGR